MISFVFSDKFIVSKSSKITILESSFFNQKTIFFIQKVFK